MDNPVGVSKMKCQNGSVWINMSNNMSNNMIFQLQWVSWIQQILKWLLTPVFTITLMQIELAFHNALVIYKYDQGHVWPWPGISALETLMDKWTVLLEFKYDNKLCCVMILFFLWYARILDNIMCMWMPTTSKRSYSVVSFIQANLTYADMPC